MTEGDMRETVETSEAASESPPADTQPTTSPGAPGDAWREVVDGLEALAAAIGKWAKAVVDDPENRRRAEQLKDRLADVGRDLANAADKAAEKIRASTDKMQDRPVDADSSEASASEGERAE